MSHGRSGKKAGSGKAKARRRKLKSYRRAVNRASYNTVLYEARVKSGLNRLKFAKAAGVSFFYYCLIESGYLKPRPKTLARLSAFCGEDFEHICEGISSYPEDLPEKERLKITVWFFNLMGSVYFRAFLALLFFASLGCLSFGYHEYTQSVESPMARAPYSLKTLMQAVRTQGTMTLSPGGTVFRYEACRMEGNDKMISIKADSDDSFPYNVDFVIHYWSDQGRLSYHVSLIENAPDTISVGWTDYSTMQAYEALIDLCGGAPVLKNLRSRISAVQDQDLIENLHAIMLQHVDTFYTDMESLVEDRLDLNFDMQLLLRAACQAASRYQSVFYRSVIFLIAGGCLALFLLFCLIYCLIYGTKNGVVRRPMTNSNLVRYARHAEPRTDCRLTPFLPETVLSLTGSTILLLSSARILNYAIVFSGSATLDLSTVRVMNTQFMNYFYLGMFLLYFLDFDTFLDDIRVMGRIFLYLFLYLGLFALEFAVMSYLSAVNSPVFNLAAGFTPPNMFGTICLYFVIMLFLFFTPRFIKTKRRLIVYRLCSLIPVLIIFGTHFISKWSDLFFEEELPLWLRLMLNEEKIAFSVLCVGYLYLLYFLRLFYEHRYGTDSAQKIFNGNRFIWVKNGLSCLLIFLIVAVNQLLGLSSRALDFGWGQTTDLLLLVPLILFYHPHKGPRNRAVDAFTMAYYLFALSYGYFWAVVMILAGGL